MTNTTAPVATVTAVREAMANAYRRTNGNTLAVKLGTVTVIVPAYLSISSGRVNVGATVLDAIAFHVEQWGASERSAIEELAQRWRDMVGHPSAPAVDIVAIDWVLDLHQLVTGIWAD